MFKRLSFPSQILIPMTLAAGLCIAAVEAWTAHVSEHTLEHQAGRTVQTSLALLNASLQRLGTEWSVEGGELRLGDVAVSGQNELLDRVTAVGGNVATIFKGDERVATNVRKPDGSRALGTKLTDPAVREAVLLHGSVYEGTATILNRRFITIYEPIRDRLGQVVGVLFTGMPAAELEEAETAMLWQAVIAGSVALALFALMGVMLLRRALRPLNALASATRHLAAGQLDHVVPGTHRSDQIGSMAAAVAVFKQSALDKLQLDAAATEQRRHNAAERESNDFSRASAAAAQSRVVEALAGGLRQLSEGNLTGQLNEAFPPQYDRLRTDYNAAIAKMAEVLLRIVESADGVGSGVGEIAQASDDLSRRTEQQAATLEQTAAALDKITATVATSAEGAKRAGAVVARSHTDAERSAEVVQQAITAMSSIEQSADEIGNIIGVIDEIAFQTNLLALNAGVEAARAGDAGRGFAVVASEVRALAQRSASAAREIKTLISTSTQQVAHGVTLVADTGQALQRMLFQVGEIATVVTAITASAEQQSLALKEVNTAVNHMDQMTQQNAAMVEQSSAAAQTLAQQATTLVQLTRRFQLDRETVAPARQLARLA